jgi:Carboxypeptidase regulatory-like domain/TonB dependent receptor/TonB-dependent Receptor Plug Domain
MNMIFCEQQARASRPVRRQISVGRSWIYLLLALVCMATGVGHAQNVGSVFGTVVDSSGALIPAAKATLSEPEHGFSRTVTSNASGAYLFTDIPVGTYTLTVEAPKFQTSVDQGIIVDANQNVKMDIRLSLGSATTDVTVTTEGSTVDSRSATLSTMIDNKLVEDLPINGENVVALAALLPGVTNVNAPTTETNERGGPTYTVSGSRNTQNLMLFDGLMWNNLFYNTGISYPPHPALQEISVLLNNYTAQYGRNSGSIFNVLTREGTNAFHGQVWDYFHNTNLDAADFFIKRVINRPQEDRQNQVGFTIGGPIKRDKAFFFVAVQDLFAHKQAIGQIQPYNNSMLGLESDGKTPYPCNVAGPFSGKSDGCADFNDYMYSSNNTNLKASNSSIPKITNPLQATAGSIAQDQIQNAWLQNGGTGQSPCIADLAVAQAFTGAKYISSPPAYPAAGWDSLNNFPSATGMPYDQIPVECFNPVMKKILNQYVPIGIQTGTAASGGPLFSATTFAPLPQQDLNILLRGDYNISHSHTLDARFNMISANDHTAPGVNSSNVGVPTYEILYNQAFSKFGNIGDTWVITPNLLNVARLGYKRYENVRTPQDPNTLASFGGNFNMNNPITAMPAINFNVFSLGSTSQGYADVINENIELKDEVSWTHGNHSASFGLDYLHLQYLNKNMYPGSIGFSTTFTSQPLADALFGVANSMTAQSEMNQGGIQNNIFMYAQDNWRVVPKLTLNLGVRYELPFQWYQPKGYSETFRQGFQSTVFPGAPGGLAFVGDPGVLKSLVPTDYNGVAPRVGFAYDIFGNSKTIVRGGFGLFFDAINADVVGEGEPFLYQFTANTPDGGFSVPLCQTFPCAGPGSTGNVTAVPNGYNPANPLFAPPYSAFFPDSNFRTPYVIATNFGFEFQVGRGGVLDMNYIGKFGRKLTVPVDLNPAIYDCSGPYFQANPAVYCNNATNTGGSYMQRVRYQTFNYGGQGLDDFMSIGGSSYNGLQLQYRKRASHGLALLATYTYSRSLDIDTNGQTTTNVIPNVFNVKTEWGPSDTNATHILNMGWAWNLPKFTYGDSFVKHVANGWIFSGIYQARTGYPVNLTINSDAALTAEPRQRPVIVAGQDPVFHYTRYRSAKIQEYYNINAFAYPTEGSYSTVGRNAFKGPAFILTTFGLGREFATPWVREGSHIMFRGEAFNVFNTVNLAAPQASFSCASQSKNLVGQPITSCSSITTTFDQITSDVSTNSTYLSGGRVMQLSLTLFY